MKAKIRLRPIICGSLAAVMLICAIIPGEVHAASSSEIQNQIDALDQRKDAIQEEIDKLKAQQSENLSQIEDIVAQKLLIEQQVQLLYLQTDSINEQIRYCNQLIADKQLEHEDARERLTALNEKYKERIRAMEEDGSLSYWEVLFSAKSFIDFLDKLNMIAEIASADQRRLEEISAAAEEVAQAQEKLNQERETLQQTCDELEATQLELDKKNAEAQTLMDQLLAKNEEYEQYISESRERYNELELELAKKEAEYDKAVEDEEFRKWLASQNASANAPVGGNMDSNGIYWVMPVKYICVSSPFNPNRVHPVLGYPRPHRGIDLAASTGTPIYATRSGVVTTASVSEEGGIYVIINHGDGFSSAYLHMSRSIVMAGQWVSAGEKIGYVGATGLVTGPHLHFSIIKNGTYVNPVSYLNFY